MSAIVVDDARVLVYKYHPDFNCAAFAQARQGKIEVFKRQVQVHELGLKDNLTAGELVGQELHEFLIQAGTPEMMIDRIIPCAEEAIPNAIRHGRINTEVLVHLIIFGVSAAQAFLLMVENVIPSGQAVILPDPNHLPNWTDQHRTSGRGIPIIRELADAFSITCAPDRAVMYAMLFEAHPH